MAKPGNNLCINYNIPCPYALGEDAHEMAGLPCCVPDQESCDKFREMYKELPEETKKGLLEGKLAFGFKK